MLGPLELGVLLAAILLLFGAGKLPKVARAMGRAPGEFWIGRTEDTDSD